MEREILFEEQAVTGFVMTEYGMYGQGFVPAPFSLTVGEEYIVLWDDVEYTVTAIDIGAFFPGGVAVGNGSAAGLPGNNEPFIVAAFETNVTLFVVDPTDTRDTHRFGIYKEAAEPANLILRDPDGTEQEYPMRQMLEVDTTAGGTVLYSKGEVLDSITIEPDFSAGDMTVSAPDGYLVQSAVIVKPENLKPENIAKNEVVAGIVGTHEGGGDGGNYEKPCMFIAIRAESEFYKSSVTANASVIIPKGAEIIDEWGRGAAKSASTNSSEIRTYAEYSTDNRHVGYATNTSGSVTKNVTMTASSSGSYRVAIALICVVYVMPGIVIRVSGGQKSIYASEEVEKFPEHCIAEKDVVSIDIQNTASTTLYANAFSGCSAETIFLPGTLTKIGKRAMYPCKRLKVLDMSKAQSVPTLEGTTYTIDETSLEKILVPSALYNEWIAATNWSAYADYIVVV